MNVDRCFVGLVICAILRVLSFDSMAGNRNQFECDELVTQENPHNINGVRILRGVADKICHQRNLDSDCKGGDAITNPQWCAESCSGNQKM